MLRIKGWTLVGLLLSMALSILCVCLVIPSYHSIRVQQERRLLIHELSTALQMAQAQAQLRHASLIVQARDKDNWASGVILRLKSTKRLVAQWVWDYPHWSLRWQGSQSQGHIVFGGDAGRGMRNGRFILCDTHSTQCQTLWLNRLGHLRAGTI